jgi:hypothetical protein
MCHAQFSDETDSSHKRMILNLLAHTLKISELESELHFETYIVGKIHMILLSVTFESCILHIS